jgi:hypothetical protein
MSRSAVLLGLLVLLAAVPITAQTVIQPEKPLDPGQARSRDAMVALRDSLNGVTAAGARLVRGVGPSSSPAWLQSRARSISSACVRAHTTMAATRPVVEGGADSLTVQVNARRTLLGGMTELDATLTACEKTWKQRASAADATPIHEQGPGEVEALYQVVQAFDKKLSTYASTQGFQLPPMGSGTPAGVP